MSVVGSKEVRCGFSSARRAAEAVLVLIVVAMFASSAVFAGTNSSAPATETSSVASSGHLKRVLASTVHAVLVANFDAPDLQSHLIGYSVAKTGQLVQLPAASGQPETGTDEEFEDVVLAPSNKFAYATDVYRDVIWGFNVTFTSTTRKLTPMPALEPFFLNNTDCPDEAVVSTSGVLYVSDDCNGNIDAFSINAKSGALTPLTGSPFAGGSCLDEMALNPAGTLLYASDECDRDVVEFSVGTSGSLTLLGRTNGGGGTDDIYNFRGSPRGLTVDPSGTYVYVTDPNRGALMEFKIEPTSGGGTSACTTGSSNTTPGCLNFIGLNSDNLSYPTDVKAEASGHYVYAADDEGDVLAEFSIEPTSGTGTALCTSGSANTTPGCLNTIGAQQVPHFDSASPECPFRLAVSGTLLYSTDPCQNMVLQDTINLSGATTCVQTGNPQAVNAAGCLSVIGTGEIADPLDGPSGLAILDPPAAKRHRRRHRHDRHAER